MDRKISSNPKNPSTKLSLTYMAWKPSNREQTKPVHPVVVGN